MVFLETKTYIPEFVECTKCNRSFDLNNLSLWSEENRICRCCKCKIENGIESCKRLSCNFHSKLQDDFIIDIDENDVRDIKPALDSQETIFNQECYCSMCQEEIPKDHLYNFLNIKHSFNGVTKRIKVKVCQECFGAFKSMLSLDKVESNNEPEEMLALSTEGERAA